MLPSFSSLKYCDMFGFGYDESNNDYKVVAIDFIYIDGDTYDNIVHIYSLKTGKWKRIGDLTHGIPVTKYIKYVNGALHWAVCNDLEPWTVVSLDLSNET